MPQAQGLTRYRQPPVSDRGSMAAANIVPTDFAKDYRASRISTRLGGMIWPSVPERRFMPVALERVRYRARPGECWAGLAGPNGTMVGPDNADGHPSNTRQG